MKKKKIIALGLVLTMAIQLLFGCGSDSNNSEESEVNNDSNETVESGTGFVENIYDMGGKTITIADGYWLGGESASPERQNCAKILEEIEKDYNCNIEVFTPNMTTLEQDITTSAAGGKVYANIICFQQEYSNIYRSGNIADVSTIKNLGLNTNNWLSISDEFSTINGVQYGVAFQEQQCQAVDWLVLAYNKDLAAKYELEDMYELVHNGEWTFDKFEEICQEVTKKSNGSVQGMINGYPCFPFFMSANAAEPIASKDGKYTYNCLSDNVLNAVQFCQDFNKNGLLDMKDYVGNDYGLTESNVFMDEKVMFHLSNYWVVSEVFSMGMPSDYGILPIPKGPDAEDYVGIATNLKSFCFIEGDPDIEDAAAILVAMANRTALSDEEWVSQQVEYSLRDDESGEMLQLILDNPTTTTYRGVLGEEWYYSLMQSVYDMSLTPRQAMEQAQQGAQAKIDEYYGQ